MEAASREAFTSEIKAEIFASLDLVESDWQDLGGFESFVFENSETNQILRMTHQSHRNPQDIAAEVEFLLHLKKHGARVCAPTTELTTIGEFHICQFEKAPGRLITQSDFTPELIQSWGAAIGKFHALSSSYEPEGAKRFGWQTDDNLDFRSRTPNDQEDLLAIGDKYLAQMAELPTNGLNYGLIHSDAHSGNFFIDGGRLSFFDFDDCCYQWFAFDVATILFSGVLHPWMANAQEAREEQARVFLPEFLKGYQTEFMVSDFLIEHLPLFLKLREFSLYAVIHSHMDVNNLEDWYPKKFMTGRRERLEADLPYLDIDFGKLSHF